MAHLAVRFPYTSAYTLRELNETHVLMRPPTRGLLAAIFGARWVLTLISSMIWN